MTDLSVTADDVISRDPCWEHDEIRAAMAGRDRWTARDFIEAFDPSTHDYDDLFWLVLHPSLIPDPTLWELACQFAEDALLAEREAGREPCKASWAAVEARRAWLRGEATEVQLRDAAQAAWEAWAAARAARVAGVARAAWVAWAAARAAWEAARVAGVARASTEAARARQLGRIREFLGLKREVE